MELTAFTMMVREFGTASLFAMLIVTVVFFSFYLCRAWREFGPRRTWDRFYTDVNQAAIGWLTTCIGGVMKNGASLIALHAQNAGAPRHLPAFVPALYITGTLIGLWGMICLMHALSRGTWYRGQWTVMIIGALLFGLFTVLSN